MEGGANPTFYGKLGSDWWGRLVLLGNRQNLDTVEGSYVEQLTVSAGTLAIGANESGFLHARCFTVSPEGVVILGSESEGRLEIGSYLAINGQVKILNGTLTSRILGDADAGFGGTGAIHVSEQSIFVVECMDNRSGTFAGSITGKGAVLLKSNSPVTFTWPQRALFEGTVQADDNITIVS